MPTIRRRVTSRILAKQYPVPEPVVWVTFIGLMGFAGAFWFAINMAFATLLMPVAVIVHELGHALVGRAMGLRVFVMNLGQGLPIARFEVKDTRVIVGRFPLHGYVKMIPTGGENQRFRVGLAVLAGPMTHLPWIGLAFVSTQPWVGINEGFAPLLAFSLFNLMAFLRNIVPLDNNDGAILVSLLFAPRDCEMSENYDIAVAMDHLERGDSATALELIDRAIERRPDEDDLVLNRGIALLQLDRTDEALDIWETLYADEDCPKHRRVFLANNIAWLLTLRGREEDLERADELSALALRAMPNTNAMLSTRGAFRITSGEHEIGERVLRRVLTTEGDPGNRANVYALLAISRGKQGDRRGSALLECQMPVDPHPALARRLQVQRD